MRRAGSFLGSLMIRSMGISNGEKGGREGGRSSVS